MELTDNQKLDIAMVMRTTLGDAYWLYGQGYCEKFERDVMRHMREGRDYKDAKKVVLEAWNIK